jgi:hypothetical protein
MKSRRVVQIIEDEPLAALPAIAARLGVQPISDDRDAVRLRMPNGDAYDLHELLQAAAGRVDTRLPRTGVALGRFRA